MSSSEEKTMANQKPQKVFQNGSCRAALFTNTVKKNGHDIEIPKVSIAKRYKASDGTWQSSGSLDTNDIPKMIAALSRAYQHLTSNDSDWGNGDDQHLED